MRSSGGQGGCGRLFLCTLALATIAQAQPAPEAASGRAAKPVVEATRYMAVTADARATRAAAAILERGGSAVDAAIAAQMVLNVVEPQSSGIGGGGFLVHWSARDRTVRTYDGRETAPIAAQPDLLLDANGKPLGYAASVVGGRSVGVPGLVAMLELAHRRHGKLAWAELFEPAIRLALEGFAIGPRLATLIAGDPWLANDREARTLYYKDGQPLAAGTVIRNTALAGALREIAHEGSGTFYRGASAQAIVEVVQSHPVNPGKLSLSDLAAYRPIERAPLCAPYKKLRICGMGPPSSGGLGVVQIVALLGVKPLAASDPRGLMSAHLFAEASRLAYADRDQYVADPGFVAVPVAAMLAPAYLARRAATIDARQAMGRALPGALAGRPVGAPAASPEAESTSHLSIVDAQGDVVAFTTSIESQFGARLMARGFLLNNQLTDFSYSPTENGLPVANRVAAGKRPRSSMAPTIVFDAAGDPLVVLGSPGGPWIIDFVAWALAGVLEQGLTLQEAIDRTQIANRNARTEVEPGPDAARLAAGLALLGHDVRTRMAVSGLHGFERVRRADGTRAWRSGVDPRREGAAAGR